MYEFRSGFMHGSLDFPCVAASMDDVRERYSQELKESISTATAILVSMLQHMIEKDWTQLFFQYVAKGTP
jgi:hypothetical protein